MRINLIRIVSFALLMAMMLGAVACADTTPEGTPETSANDPAVAETTEAITPETTEINAENLLGERNFGGETLTIYARKYNGAWSSDLLVEDEDGTVVNNAIYKRNAKLSTLYSVNFEQIESGKRDCLDDFVKVVSSGDTTIHATYLGLTDAATAAQRGYLHDITKLENVNLEGEWWTQSLNKAWSIGNKQYFATGAITTIDDQAIRTMFFNKEIIAEHNLKTIYDLVYDNEWVFDKFFEYAEIANKDDGDGQQSLSDTFGACAQTTLGFMMTMGSGEMLAAKDADDYPIIAANSSATRFIDVVTYLTEKISGNNAIYQGDDQVIRDLFGNNQALFYAEVLMHAQTMRVNYDVDFGIIPMPKYNADQENYYQYSTGRNTTVIAFPNATNGDDLDMGTFMIEAMAIESVNTVKPAYYDICLKGRYAGDAKDVDMLDIVTTSVATDYAEIYAWGSFHSTVQNAITSGAPIASILKKNSVAAEKVMKKTIDDFMKLN
ncbi:MAG: hypothetical protein J6S14_07295 [Clostridia bacterium]|nr:hypothetical protein [Clostridia bacterium]